MKYERLIRRLLEAQLDSTEAPPPLEASAADTNIAPGSKEDFFNELTKKGYKIEKEATDPVADAMWNHDPTNPETSCADAEDKIALATLRLERGFFALGSFLNYLNPVCNDSRVASAAVDQSGNFYYNSDFINKLSIGQVAGLIMHEISHIGMGDLYRSKGLDGERWNIASDYVNNWYIMNDLITLNAGSNEQGKDGLKVVPKGGAQVVISLPLGGLFPDPDGVVRNVRLDDEHVLVFPENKQIDLSSRSTEEVYEMLKELDDNIVNAMNNERFDSHISDTSINAVTIEEVLTNSGGSAGGGKGPIIPADLKNLLVIDKRTGQLAVVVSASDKNKTATIVPLSRQDVENIKREFDLNDLPIQ